MRRIYYGRWVVGGAFIVLFCAVGIYFYAFPVFFDAMMRDMGWSRVQTSAALSIGLLVIGAMGLLIGRVIRKIGLKPVMIFGSVLAGVGFVLLSTVSVLWQFYIFYGLVLSIGIACIYLVPNMTAVQSWFVEKRSTALGIATSGVGAGGLVMAPLAGWLISMYGWQTAFLFMAAIVVLIGVPVSAVIMRTSWEGKFTLTGRQRGGNNSSIPPVEGLTLSQAMKQRAFWFIFFGWMLFFWAYGTGFIHQVAFAVDMGIERTVAAGAVGLLCAFSIIGRLGFGRLGDVIDKRFVFVIAASFQIAAFIVLVNTTNVTMLYIYSLLIGVGMGGVGPILPGLIADYFGSKYFGGIYAASFFVLLFGTVIGPVYAGWIFDTTGSYSFAFLTSIVLSFVAIISVYLSGWEKPQVRQ